ncbi:MAG: DUF4349 domain-containing protein [Actinomycetia bacterium]|jgi:hypothetical protein|nr:DUF4349 domain-containing protein [Actinomycetes bacterium]
MVVLGSLLAGCGGGTDESGGAPDAATAPETVPDGGTERQGTDSGVGSEGAPALEDGSKTTVALQQRSVIRTASVRLRADDVLVASKQAVVLVTSAGGLVAGEQTVIDPDDPDLTVSLLTLRVPEARLGDLLADLAELGTVLSQDQTATDVTEQVVDVQSRIQSQTESVNRVRALLARANTIGEIVQIEAQLATREAELEALQAQAKQLASQTVLATVTVSIVGPDPAGTDDDPSGFAAGLQQGWDAFVAAATWLLTALGVLLPFLLLGLVVAVPVVTLVRRRSARTSPPSTPA